MSNKRILFVHNSVIQFSKFSAIPPISRSHKITRNALQPVNIGTSAVGALLQVRLGILVAAIHTAIAIVVDRAIANVIFIHQVYDILNGLRVMRGIAINLHIEDMTSAGKFVIWTLNLCLMAR
jgi:hypothetical protein